MKRTLIVSAFPACGKTYLYNNQKNLVFNFNGEKICYSFLDSDSSKFIKYDGWEKEYADHIEKNIGSVDFIFVSQHDLILQELKDRQIPFITVAPDNTSQISAKEKRLIKQQWFGRFVLRDNSHISDINAWLKNLSENYDNWTSEEQLTKYDPVSFFVLNANQYLSDIIEDLYWKKETYDCYVKTANKDAEALKLFN